jgi:hypothetical protein
MSYGILKTALTTTIRLDLSYREPNADATRPVAFEANTAAPMHASQIPVHDSETLLRMRWMFIGDVR